MRKRSSRENPAAKHLGCCKKTHPKQGWTMAPPQPVAPTSPCAAGTWRGGFSGPPGDPPQLPGHPILWPGGVTWLCRSTQPAASPGASIRVRVQWGQRAAPLPPPHGGWSGAPRPLSCPPLTPVTSFLAVRFLPTGQHAGHVRSQGAEGGDENPAVGNQAADG